MTTQQPQWYFIANLGDASPVDYGGYFIYGDRTGVHEPEAEYLESPDSDLGGEWRVYRFILERMAVVMAHDPSCGVERRILLSHRLAEAHRNQTPDYYGNPGLPHPLHEYDEWFHDDLAKVALSSGLSTDDLYNGLCSDDPCVRARAYQTIYEYHGWDNADNYPLVLTIRGEVALRYHEGHKALVDARNIIRNDAQTIVSDADAWHQLSRVLNYLDAQIDNIRTEYGWEGDVHRRP